MRRVNLIILALVAFYTLAAGPALGQGEKAVDAIGEQVGEKITAGPTSQDPVDNCVTESKGAYWHLIYPGTTAFYVGGTVRDMQLHKDSILSHPWSLTGVRQLQRKGHIALTSDCLLFAFKATSNDRFILNENANRHFHIHSCSNDISLSENKPTEATCAGVDAYQPIKLLRDYDPVCQCQSAFAWEIRHFGLRVHINGLCRGRRCYSGGYLQQHFRRNGPNKRCQRRSWRRGALLLFLHCEAPPAAELHSGIP
jgi:hypothetical protein